MDKVTSEFCDYCKGSGVDQEGINMGNPYACTECKGTGFKYENEGKKQYFKEMDEEEKRREEEGHIF